MTTADSARLVTVRELVAHALDELSHVEPADHDGATRHEIEWLGTHLLLCHRTADEVSARLKTKEH